MAGGMSFVDFAAARWASLYRTAYLLTAERDEAEDLVQTALVKAYVQWRRVAVMSSPEAYVRRIVVNSFLSTRRRAAHRREVSRADVPERGLVSHESAVVERDRMWSQIQRLPDRQRAVLVLRYYEDLSEASIAELLGCSRGTVKSQASDGLRSLRRMLDSADATGSRRKGGAQ